VSEKKPFQTSIKTASGKWLRVAIAEQSDRLLRVEVDGETFEVHPEDIAGAQAGESHAAMASTRVSQSQRQIKSPMPGVVSRILVSAGDRIAENQPLIVLLAMKMENEILGEGAGVVKQIWVKPNQTVQSGDLLIELV